MCLGCNAIEFGDVLAADGERRVCTTCPHRAMAAKISDRTLRALSRITERAEKIKRDDMSERMKKSDQVKQWWKND